MNQGKTHPIYFAAVAAVLLFSLLGAIAPGGMPPGANAVPPAVAH